MRNCLIKLIISRDTFLLPSGVFTPPAMTYIFIWNKFRVRFKMQKKVHFLFCENGFYNNPTLTLYLSNTILYTFPVFPCGPNSLDAST